MNDLAELYKDLRQLCDERDIERLMIRYSYGANIIDGQPGDVSSFGALFTDTAVWNVGMGEYVGRAAIEARMREITTPWHIALHLIVNPLIEVNGDTAAGMFTCLFPILEKADIRPLWMSKHYRNGLVRTADGWRIQSLTVDDLFEPVEFRSGYDEKF